jgi:NADPH:quinone reductase-like Zn-dependent oxidoreductase/acyl transferase domain-containing protein
MAALATSKEVALEYLRDISSGTAVIGCVNSHLSMTISGDVSALVELEARAEADGVLFRRLKVPAAYHSIHMDPLAQEYHQKLDKHLQKPTLPESNIIFSSPVTGKRVENSEKKYLSDPSHWVQNMVQCVQFEDALKDMLISDESEKAGGTQFTVDAIIEIGPHGALQGPIRQILSQSVLKECTATNGPSLKRGEDAVRTMGSLASRLFCQGYPVNFDAVNFPNSGKNLHVINDLPAYPWNHSAKYWLEPAAVTESLQRKFPPHDLLGVRVPGLNSDTYIWRNVIRVSDLPWLKDHTLQTQILFPGAGLATMAIEAMRQIASPQEQSFGGYMLYDADLYTALVVPTSDDGVEVQVVLRNQSSQVLEAISYKEFSIFSRGRDGKWIGHCKGKVGIASGKPESPTVISESKLTSLDMDTFYDRISRGGPTLGPSFQNVSSIDFGGGSVVATLIIADTISYMPVPYESSYFIHPTTMDACFQIAWGTMAGSVLDKMGICLPEFAQRMYLSSNTNQQPGAKLKAVASLSHISQQGFEVSVSLFELNGSEERLVMKSDGLRVKSLIHKPSQVSDQVDNTAVQQPVWKPDISVLSTKDFQHKQRNGSGAYSLEESQQVVVNIIHDTLKQLDKDKPNLQDHHRKLVSLLRRRNEELYSSFAVHDEGNKREIYQKFITSNPNGQLFGLLSDKLTEFLESKTNPEDDLLLDQLLQTYSANTPQYGSVLEKLKAYISLFAHKYPRARILEVGAGVGTVSAAVIEGLSQGNPEILSAQRYDYTDTSASSFSDAERRFESFGSQIRYLELDIERSPTEQGFAAESYDLVIASNVLHNTANISESVKNLRQLVKIGGTALILETTTTHLEQSLAFGLLPSWWSSEEKERQASPLLDTKSWESVLTEHGFNSPNVVLHDSETIDGSTYSFLAVTAADNPSSEASATYPKETVLIQLPNSHDAAPQKKLDQLSQLLHNSTGTVVSVAELGKSSLQNKTGIIWVQSKDKFLSKISPESFILLQTAMLEADNVLWVSHSAAGDDDEAEAAMSVGFLRTLRLEDVSKTYVTLDLDPQEGCWSPAAIQVISDTFRYALGSDNQERREYEFSVRSGQLNIHRLAGNRAINEQFGRLQGINPPQLKEFSFSGPYTYLEVASPGLLDSLVFKEDEPLWQSRTWTEEMVEITPHALGLNFRDVLVAMDQMQEKWMGFECAGYVSRVGSQVPNNLKVGDRVCALMQAGNLANKIRTPWHSVMPIPSNMTLETAASVPIIFGTAYHALVKLADLQAGESVLIHSAAGGVGLAAITMAKYLKAEIFVTVGSEEKREFLAKEYGISRDRMFSSRDVSFADDVMRATGGRGVDVVLNSLAGPLLQASWDCVATMGRFIELGKQDSQSNKSLGMRNFSNSTAYIAMDLVKLGIYNGKALFNSFKNVVELFANEQIKHQVPVLLYELSNLREAFRKLQGGRHIGKFVIRVREGQQVQVCTNSSDLSLSLNIPLSIQCKLTFL